MAKSDDIADEYVTIAVLLAMYEVQLNRVMQDLLAELHNTLRLGLLALGLKNVKRQETKLRLVEQYALTADKLIAEAYLELGRRLMRELKQLIPLISAAQVTALNKATGTEQFTTKISDSDLRKIVAASLTMGSLSKDWWKGQSQRTRQQMASQMRVGVLAGEGSEDLVRRLLGVSRGRRTITTAAGDKLVVPTLQGGVLQAGRRNVKDLTVAASQAAANQAALEMFKLYKAKIDGLQLLAVLDGKTTLLCIGRAGATWDMDGNPLPDSPWPHQFPGAPPFHFNCRSLLIPIIGEPAKDISYEDWLRTKPESFQRKVLGPARWKLWKAGKLSTADLTDVSGSTLTLDELRTEFAPSTN